MAEGNKMKDMPVNKLMIQMGIPMILSCFLRLDFEMRSPRSLHLPMVCEAKRESRMESNMV